MALGEWSKTTSDVASTRRVTVAKLHIVADTLNQAAHTDFCPWCALVTSREKLRVKRKFIHVHSHGRRCVWASPKSYKDGKPKSIMAQAKNNTNNAIKFNVTFGTKGADTMPANAAVLLRNCRKRIDGELVEVTEFMAVTGVRRTKGDSIMLPLLALMVADAKVRNGFATEFKSVTINGKTIDTKLVAKSTFTRWLSGESVYKTDSEGRLSNELTVDDGMLLKHTALNVRKTSPMLEAEGDELTELLKVTAKAIAKQANLRSLILKTAKTIFNAADGQAQDSDTDATE